MANVKFVIPEESLSSQLFTDTGRWMNEEKLENFSFSFNKSVNEIPAKLEQSYYIAGEGVSFTAEQEEKLDRVLETIKLYLSKSNMEQVKSITVVEEEIVTGPEKCISVDVATLVDVTMQELKGMPESEQNNFFEELFIALQEERRRKVLSLEVDIENVKESSYNLYEILKSFKPKGIRRR